MDREEFRKFVELMTGFAESLGIIISSIGWQFRFEKIRKKLTLEELDYAVDKLANEWENRWFPNNAHFIKAVQGDQKESRSSGNGGMEV
jgi:hypothetical protein